MTRLGVNLVLASLLSLLSYVPFEWVAKGSLLVCAFLFIVDPFPPQSRLISLVALAVVALLSRAYKSVTKTEQSSEETVRIVEIKEDSKKDN